MIYSVHGYYGKYGSRKMRSKIEAIVFASSAEHARQLVEDLFKSYPAYLEDFSVNGGVKKSLDEIYADRPELKGIKPTTGYIYSEFSHINAIYRYFK